MSKNRAEQGGILSVYCASSRQDAGGPSGMVDRRRFLLGPPASRRHAAISDGANGLAQTCPSAIYSARFEPPSCFFTMSKSTPESARALRRCEGEPLGDRWERLGDEAATNGSEVRSPAHMEEVVDLFRECTRHAADSFQVSQTRSGHRSRRAEMLQQRALA